MEVEVESDLDVSVRECEEGLEDLQLKGGDVPLVELDPSEKVQIETPLLTDTLLVDHNRQVSLKTLKQHRVGAAPSVAAAQAVKVPEMAWKAMQREKQFSVIGYTLTVTGTNCNGSG